MIDLDEVFALSNLSLYRRVHEAKKVALKESDADSFAKSCHTLIHLITEASSKQEYELAEKTYKFFQELITKTNLSYT